VKPPATVALGSPEQNDVVSDLTADVTRASLPRLVLKNLAIRLGVVVFRIVDFLVGSENGQNICE
jgi:hypothetical protein